MTPSARIAAAIEILDSILAPNPVEKTLTNWGRSNRYAGSGDRAAIRDFVFDALRRRRSVAHLGGAQTGRGLMIGLVRANQQDTALLFTGEKYAPAALDAAEEAISDIATAERAVRLDCPDWLLPRFDSDLGADAEAVLTLLQSRAPVYLRVNVARCDLDRAIKMLAEDGIQARAHPLSEAALEVTEKPRKVSQNEAYLQGLIEFQDVGSQAVVDGLPVGDGKRILDFCAGGGGKSLALAARTGKRIFAHDALPQRMKDLPDRAQRAGASVKMETRADLSGQEFDLVLCDVPCSGSGSWRRSPEAKWELSRERLDELGELQAFILQDASALVAPDGTLAYVTCSLFAQENRAQVDDFLGKNPAWNLVNERQYSPLEGGDGFYVALLTRAQKSS